MGLIGKIIGSIIGANKDSPGNVRLLTVQMSEDDDNQVVEQFGLAGIDSCPPDDGHVVTTDVGDFVAGIGVSDDIEPESLPGEIEMYSSGDGVKKARMKCSGDNVTINLGTKSAAREGHEITITALTDHAFFTWMASVASFTGTAAPTSVTGKINEGSETVKIP